MISKLMEGTFGSAGVYARRAAWPLTQVAEFTRSGDDVVARSASTGHRIELGPEDYLAKDWVLCC